MPALQESNSNRYTAIKNAATARKTNEMQISNRYKTAVLQLPPQIDANRRMANAASSPPLEILIANLELEFHLTHTKLSPLKISNRKYFVVSHPDFALISTNPPGAAAGGDPVEETLHAGAFTPHQGEEFAGVEIRGFMAEEGFHAPLDIRRGPGAETVTFGDDPVVAEGVQHVACNSNMRTSGRISADAIEVEAIKLGAMRGR
jgi:hypothetical protein